MRYPMNGLMGRLTSPALQLRRLLGPMLALVVLCAPALAQNAPANTGPVLRATASIATPQALTVGGTATLQVDVLTTTWFTQPPQLPALNIPGALVTGPTGDATLIRDAIDGVAASGLRYAYQISPTVAGKLRVPEMRIRAQVGQSSVPLEAKTAALDLQAANPPGMPAGHQGLAATSVQMTQQITYSAKPPAIGDHIRRVITVEAQGAQAMLIPPPVSAEVPGLKIYRSEPVVQPLTDSRGGFLGGQRVDQIDYVVERAGAYTLPEVELGWWNLSEKRAARAVLPAEHFDALAGAAYQTPFSVQQDLQELGRRMPWRLSASWLPATAAVLVAALVLWWGRPWRRRAWRGLRDGASRARQRWQASEPYAARAMRHELAHPSGHLNAWYRWLRVSRRSVSVAEAMADAPIALRKAGSDALRDCYGTSPDSGRGIAVLRELAPRWRRWLRRAPVLAADDALRPLNPGHAYGNTHPPGDRR